MPNAEERLKAMTQGAVSLEADRTARLAQMREADTRDAQREEQERMLRKGGVEASFVRRQKEDMWEKNIAER